MKLRRISLVANPYNENGGELLRETAAFFRDRGVEIYVNRGCRTDLSGFGVISASEERIYDGVDLAVILGGDGTMLRCAKKAARRGVPMIGINLGKVGFMSGLESHEVPLLGRLFDGSYSAEERMMLRADLIREGEYIGSADVLNEAVISHGVAARLIELELRKNGGFIGNYRADGIIAATPTGSTAYSLAAGGPVIEPGLDCICVTPICPYNLASKTIVFPPDAVLDIVNTTTRVEAALTLDGAENIRIQMGDTVRLVKSPLSVTIISVKPNGFYDAVSGKIPR